MFCQNLCIFSGRLGADPEVKEFDWGTVLKFGIAVDMPRMDKPQTLGSMKRHGRTVSSSSPRIT